MGKFLIRVLPGGFRFDLTAGNGKTIASSEVYTTLAACRKGMESVRCHAPLAKLEELTDPEGERVTNPKFELYRDRGQRYRFRLKAKNGKIIAVSEPYTTRAACLAGIKSVQLNAPEAPEELWE